MNQRLADAIESIQRLPEDRQDDAALLLELFLTRQAPPVEWTDEQLTEIRAGMAEADRGEFLSEQETAELFPRLRR